MLDLGRNALSGTLPSNLAQLPRTTALGLSVFDNLLSGTVPPAYTSLSWVALAYNPYLVGALPSGFAPGSNTKLRAWSASGNGYNTWANLNTAVAPTSGSGFLYGTSIGLDRPLVSILADVKAALDPSGAMLTSWNSSAVQPCPPWLSGNANPVQSATTPGYGRAFAGVTCSEWDGAVLSATSNLGGLLSLILTGTNFNGTLPDQLRELRTATQVTLRGHALSGTVPTSWCARRAPVSCPALATRRARAHGPLPRAALPHRTSAAPRLHAGRV